MFFKNKAQISMYAKEILPKLQTLDNHIISDARQRTLHQQKVMKEVQVERMIKANNKQVYHHSDNLAGHFEVNERQKQFQQEKKLQEQIDQMQFILPLSHQTRQKSLSPIKNQNSVSSEWQFSISGPKINMISMPSVDLAPEKSQKSQARSSNSFIYSSKITHSNRKNIQNNDRSDKSFDSAKRSHVRRTQIFSSDKKRIDGGTFIRKNTKAEQILNQSKQQQKESKKQLNPVVLNNTAYRSKQFEESPLRKRSKVESFVSLSQNKSKQIKKLDMISQSPQRASNEYWESIYPQSKRYLISLSQILAEQKKVIFNWQSQLQLTLRQNLYEVEQNLLQKFYKICRMSVKSWIQEEMDFFEVFVKEQFSYFNQIKTIIEQRQHELQSVQSVLQNLKNSTKTQNEQKQFYKVMKRTILSPEYSQQVTQISFKVKQVISKSQETALMWCQQRLEKVQKFQIFQNVSQQFNLQKKSYGLLKALFKNQKQTQKFNKKVQIPLINQDLNIGQRIQKVIQKSQIRNAQTARQVKINQFAQNSYRQPMSHRKNKIGGFNLRDKSKDYQEFKSEFQKRKKNFMANSFQIYGQDRKVNQRPISLKVDQSISFEKKLDSLLRKINNQKQSQQQDLNRDSLNTNNYNEYNQIMRIKKQKDRQNFFRYSMQ